MDNIINDLKKNKKLISICLLIIIFTILIINVFNNKKENIASKEENELIEKYDANEYIPISITEEEIALKYLNDFKNIILSDTSKAYELLNNEYKNKKYGTYENFEKSIKEEFSLAFNSMTIKEYSIIKKGKYKYFYIRNNRDDLFVFKEISIMNYEVFLDNYTVEIK